jgi:hypothetical protein
LTGPRSAIRFRTRPIVAAQEGLHVCSAKASKPAPIGTCCRRSRNTCPGERGISCQICRLILSTLWGALHGRIVRHMREKWPRVRIGLVHTRLATATCGTIRLKLLEIAAQIRLSVRRLKVAMTSACAHAQEFAHTRPCAAAH